MPPLRPTLVALSLPLAACTTRDLPDGRVGAGIEPAVEYVERCQ
ncbi:MAG: hypothetical protein ACM3OH_14225 [Bacillota bacterium]|jgi:hypothetical protein